MLYVIKDGVRELDQWCNKLLHYGEAVKQDDCPKVSNPINTLYTLIIL